MKDLFYIFIGGGIGSLCRFFTSKWFNNLFENFPTGTFIANVVSSFIVGLVLASPFIKSDTGFYRYFFVVGICGGFSTFSGFSNETFHLLKTGNYQYALINIALNIVICILAIIAGMKFSEMLH